MKQQRDFGFDNMRGILMILVIFGHLLEHCGSFPGAGFLYRTIYSFHMPAFLFLTGYFARFHRRKIICGLFVPYVVFQTAYILFDRWLYGGDTQLQYTTPYWILWYLMACILYHLLLPLYDEADPRRQLLALGITFCLSLAAGFDATVGYRLSLSRFLTFQPWFLLGHYCRRSGWIPDRCGSWIKVGLTVAVALLALVMHRLSIRAEVLYGAHPYSGLNYGPGERLLAGLTAFLWISFGCLVMLPLLRRRVPMLTALGQNTMPVYLLHGFAVRYIGQRHPELLAAPWQVLLAAAAILTLCGNPPMGRLFRNLFGGNRT